MRKGWSQNNVYHRSDGAALLIASVVGFFTVSSNETTRGHICNLFVCHSRVDVRKYFLCNRVVKI